MEIRAEKTEIKIETDITVTVKAICHQCMVEFDAHPLFVDGFPILFPHWICKKCRESDIENEKNEDFWQYDD